MKLIFSFFLIFINFMVLLSQLKNPYDENKYLNCNKDKLDWNKIISNSDEYSYTLIEKNYFASDGDKHYYQGIIILPINKVIEQNKIEEILKQISIKENLFQITALKKCEAQKLFKSSTLTKQEEKELLKNIIGLYKLDLK